jgi:hypothetical protein
MMQEFMTPGRSDAAFFFFPQGCLVRSMATA